MMTVGVKFFYNLVDTGICNSVTRKIVTKKVEGAAIRKSSGNVNTGRI